MLSNSRQTIGSFPPPDERLVRREKLVGLADLFQLGRCRAVWVGEGVGSQVRWFLGQDDLVILLGNVWRRY